MKEIIILFLIIGSSNIVFGQIKVEKQVKYWLHKDSNEKGFHLNSKQDSCVIFWKEFNQNGMIIKEHDFPSDRCWEVKGPWEHHYSYNSDDRLIEHKYFGGTERVLRGNAFYSYPYLDDLNKANEAGIRYNYRAKTRIEREQIDTFFLDTVNTKGLHSFSRTGWIYDTTKNSQGHFIFRKDFKYQKELFTSNLIEKLIDHKTIKDFEIALKSNISEISYNLTKIHKTEDSYSCEFIFKEKNQGRQIKIKKTEHFIEIKYSFINKKGDNYLTFLYEYRISKNTLKKKNFVKAYIDYY